MGTRSQTVVVDTDGTKYLQMYRQMDGYPTGHGKELLDFCKPVVPVNGFNDREYVRQTNGIGCFAAQLVAAFKTGVGGFYLESHDTEIQEHDYTYRIVYPEGTGGQIHIDVFCWDDDAPVFSGDMELFKAWLDAGANE